MKATHSTGENEKRDWVVIALILLFGLLGVLLAGEWALRFAPRWELDASARSLIDPNSDFLTNKPDGYFEPIDPAILTNPVSLNNLLTPGFSLSNGTPFLTTNSTSATPTIDPITATQPITATTVASVTNTANPTNTLVYFPPSTSTPRPNPASTNTPVVASTSTPTFAATATATSTSTVTATATATATPTVSATPTFTATTDPSEPDFGGPDGNTLILGNGTWIQFNLSGFVLDGNPAWDVVYYETEETSSAGKIHLGAVLIEVYDATTAAWYTVYHWGDGNVDANASYNNGNSEPDGFPVDKSLLYGTPPLNTGIAIDIDSVAIAQGGAIGDAITLIRITSLSSVDCDIDALQMLR